MEKIIKIVVRASGERTEKRCIELFYLEEKSYDEIAQITGINTKNVSVKLVRIKKKLEKILTSIMK